MLVFPRQWWSTCALRGMSCGNVGVAGVMFRHCGMLGQGTEYSNRDGRTNDDRGLVKPTLALSYLAKEKEKAFCAGGKLKSAGNSGCVDERSKRAFLAR